MLRLYNFDRAATPNKEPGVFWPTAEKKGGEIGEPEAGLPISPPTGKNREARVPGVSPHLEARVCGENQQQRISKGDK